MTHRIEHLFARPIEGHEPIPGPDGVQVQAHAEAWQQLRERIGQRMQIWLDTPAQDRHALGPVLTYASDGGGAQSTAIKRLAAHGAYREPDCYIFADTQYESIDVYDSMRALHRPGGNDAVRVPSIVATAGDLREDQAVKRAAGGRSGGAKRFAALPFFTRAPGDLERGMVRRQCTGEYKIDVVRAVVRMLLGLQKRARFARLGRPYVEAWLGISVDEIQRAKMSTDQWLRIEHPLLDLRMTRDDCYAWLERHGYPRPARSACIGCPLRGTHEWLELRDKHPEEFASAVEFDALIRHSAGMQRPCFVHSSCVPLAEVNFDALVAPAGQGDFWNGCSSGWCGT